jgi:hypothetical protein
MAKIRVWVPGYYKIVNRKKVYVKGHYKWIDTNPYRSAFNSAFRKKRRK